MKETRNMTKPSVQNWFS